MIEPSLVVVTPVIAPPRPGLVESWTHRPHLCVINGEHDLWSEVCREHGLIATASHGDDGQVENLGCPASWNMAFRWAKANGIEYVAIMSQGLVLDGGTGRLPRMMARFGDWRGLRTLFGFHCIVISVKAWELVGQFDEHLPIWCDADFQRQAFLAGLDTPANPIPGVWGLYVRGDDHRNTAVECGAIAPSDYVDDQFAYFAKWGGLGGDEVFSTPYDATSPDASSWNRQAPRDAAAGKWLAIRTALTAQDCAELIDRCRPIMFEDQPDPNRRTVPGPTGMIGVAQRHSEDPTAGWQPVVDLVQRLTAYAENVFPLGGVEGIRVQIVYYLAGARHVLHRDSNTDPSRRWLGLIVMLSDPDDYQGGQLVLGDEEPLTIPQGAAIVVRGDLEHEVTPVTAGERWVITAFAVGPRSLSAVSLAAR